MTTHKGKGSTPKMTIEQGDRPAADAAADVAAGAAAAEADASGSSHAKDGVSFKSSQRTQPLKGIDLEDAVGFVQGIGALTWAYAVNHPYTVGYGFVGLVLAILVLTIGLWSTIVIAVFVLVGAMIGQIRDGDNGIVNFFSGLINGHRS